MNVSAGDLAYVVCLHPIYNGKIVKVLYVAPYGDFILPDKFPASVSEHTSTHWVIEFSEPVMAPLDNGKWRMTRFGTGKDSCLRRIAGPSIKIDEQTESPIKETA